MCKLKTVVSQQNYSVYVSSYMWKYYNIHLAITFILLLHIPEFSSDGMDFSILLHSGLINCLRYDTAQEKFSFIITDNMTSGPCSKDCTWKMLSCPLLASSFHPKDQTQQYAVDVYIE